MTARRKLLFVLAMGVALANPASRAILGQVTLKAGETQTVSIFGFGGYQSVRVCNDVTSPPM